jgi:hypothetical protein
MIKFERTSYLDAEKIKYKNRRTVVIQHPSGKYRLGFKVLSTDSRPRALHHFERGIVTTSLDCSIEGAVALYLALQAQLIKDGVITESSSAPQNLSETN